MPTLETGHAFERYRVIRWLGSGASGESYEAEDSMLLRKVTLKLIHPQSTLPDSARRQFFRELQGISALNHPYLAPVLDYGEINSRLYIARKFVTSGSLLGTEGRLWFRPPFNVSDAIHYTHQLAKALHYIHTRGYLHGSITFSNILVLRGPNLDNEAEYAPFMLADVGLSNFVRRFGREPRPLLPLTAAPEQLGNRITPASDQFALAVLLYFWLAGRPPYLGTPEEIEHLKLSETITPLSTLNTQVSIEQSGILLRALAAYPEDRYPSTLAFAEALLKTLRFSQSPSVALTIPITEPAQFDGIAIPSYVPPVIEHEEEQEALAAEVVVEEVVVEEPVLSSTPGEAEQTPRDFDREPSVTPVLAIAAEQPPAEEQTPRDFDREPSVTPVLAIAPEQLVEQLQEVEIAPVVEPAPEIELVSAVEPAPAIQSAPLIQLDAIPETDPAIAYEPETHSELDAAEVVAPIEEDNQQTPETVEVEPLADQPASTDEPASEPSYASSGAEATISVSPAAREPAPEIPLWQPEHATISNSEMEEVQPARVIVTSPYAGEPYEVRLEGDEFSIGRAGSSAILLDQDNLTSRHHALLKHEDNRYLLFDSRSANGVFVNGQKINVEIGYELLDGDHISIGNYELIFRSSAPANHCDLPAGELNPIADYEMTHLI